MNTRLEVARSSGGPLPRPLPQKRPRLAFGEGGRVPLPQRFFSPKIVRLRQASQQHPYNLVFVVVAPVSPLGVTLNASKWPNTMHEFCTAAYFATILRHHSLAAPLEHWWHDNTPSTRRILTRNWSMACSRQAGAAADDTPVHPQSIHRSSGDFRIHAVLC